MKKLNGKMDEIAHISNLLPEISIDIFSRLPVRTIISCKCVCKKWLNLISSPEFANHHLSRSTPVLIVSNIGEFPTRMFDSENTTDLLSHDLYCRRVIKFDPNLFSTSPSSEISITCSTNGLLCLYDYNSWIGDYEALYVCNPVTREYISLPLLPRSKIDMPICDLFACGIGKSRLSGNYKVVHIFHELICVGGMSDPLNGVLETKFMVHTIGTDSWRSIRVNENNVYNDPDGAFLNGNLHWLVGGSKGQSQRISCFDLESELFKHFSPPNPSDLPLLASLSILGNCLCFCDSIMGKELDIWIMNEYGLEESWTKNFVISYADVPHSCRFDNDRLRILKVLKNGDLLLFREFCLLLIHRKKIKVNRKIYVIKRGTLLLNWWMKAVLHTPSFISLRSYGWQNVCSF